MGTKHCLLGLDSPLPLSDLERTLPPCGRAVKGSTEHPGRARCPRTPTQTPEPPSDGERVGGSAGQSIRLRAGLLPEATARSTRTGGDVALSTAWTGPGRRRT